MVEAWQRDDLRPKFGDSRGVCGVVRSAVGISSLPLGWSSSQEPNPLQITNRTIEYRAAITPSLKVSGTHKHVHKVC